MLEHCIDALETKIFEVDYGDGEHCYALSEVKTLENIKKKLRKAFG